PTPPAPPPLSLHDALPIFAAGWQRVKLYYLCGLPGERTVDLDGIVDQAETISRIGKEVKGRFVEVTASVSNFVPKPHTPYQWNRSEEHTSELQSRFDLVCR